MKYLSLKRKSLGVDNFLLTFFRIEYTILPEKEISRSLLIIITSRLNSKFGRSNPVTPCWTRVFFYTIGEIIKNIFI